MANPRKPKSQKATVWVFVQNLPEEYLKCRQYGHAWDPWTVNVERGTYDVIIRCARCESMAKEVVSRKGDRVRKRSTKYAPGYLSKGLGRLDGEARSMLRLEGVLRAVDPKYHHKEDSLT